jgi:hypothetical protein
MLTLFRLQAFLVPVRPRPGKRGTTIVLQCQGAPPFDLLSGFRLQTEVFAVLFTRLRID